MLKVFAGVYVVAIFLVTAVTLIDKYVGDEDGN